MHKFPYKWTLADANFTKDKGKVFSCFSCGGGSTMGYKLAGFDVLGCCEIDPEILRTYIANHKPKYKFGMSLQFFKKHIQNKIADGEYQDLLNLDILDGSPPCSSFSLAGDREEGWGKKKEFREGQKEQILDTLFFDFIELADFLKPKIVIAENVKGLLMGKAREYVKKIYRAFDEAGYTCQHFLVDGAKMGVPQKRERVFFIALRKDLAEPFMKYSDMFTAHPYINMTFNEPEIKFGQVRSEVGNVDKIGTERGDLMQHAIFGDKSMADVNLRVAKKNSGFNSMIRYDEEVCGTITAGETDFRFYDKLACTDYDYIVCGTFPLDYKFMKKTDKSFTKYLIGMSVPPVMTAQIASRVWEYWLSRINILTNV
jgi:DNA (cytosine-5)-methyltransferase 1